MAPQRMSVHSCETADLVALMRAGDLEALDRFSRCYGPRLVAIARRSCRTTTDAEDAVQDALVEASRSMRSYRGDGSPLAWLSTLVVRRCGRLARGRRNDPSLRVTDVELVCHCSSPETRAHDHALGTRLSAALMALSETDRFAVILADQGHTGPEIAAELGLTANAVRARLKRARAALRVELVDLVC